VRFLVAVVGRPRHPGLAAAIADYESRAARYWPLDVAEVREEGGRSQAPEIVRRREGERLLERVGDLPLVACDVAGDTLSSAEFARQLQQWREGARSTAFVIGGAHGLDDAVRKRASRTFSLAPFTLPHELARLVLAEQLYRAGTIVRGEPYHK
jgi:23S rRNA (pseudouridine1915-N3)-methyltransferase